MAAVGAKFKKCPGSKVPEQGLLPDGSSVIPPGRVWRRVSRVGGQGPDVELTTLNNDDDPNAIYISEAVLMNECKVCLFHSTISITRYLCTLDAEFRQ